MKPVPAPQGMDPEGLPTFEDLKERTGLTISALRARLARVTCWKFSDNSTRYDAEAAEAAIAGLEDEDAEAFDPERKVDPLFLLNKQISINGQLVKQCTDIIKSMGEPLRSGVEIWKASGERQEKRLEALEKNVDRMLGVIEAGLNAQHERDMDVKRNEAAIAHRGQLVELVKDQLPSVVSKWAVTAEATKALNFIRNLNPLLVDHVVKSGVLEPSELAELESIVGRPLKPKAEPEASRGDAPRAEGESENAEVQDEKS